MAIQYKGTAIGAMLDDMARYGSTMKNQIDELQAAAGEFRANMSGDVAIANFDAKHGELSLELEDTLVKLDNLGIKVENAFHRAIETDKRVGDGFAAF
ncbi:hypothetical protein [Nocardia jinanensis]|uniref:Uncharacterized protein n=1 Tax=Nocardia jinanensis TaxID=382504 RepID=A0A917RBF1_9NOCA|nr:hypothetical protein [Nocardia jinanensis]GGK98707.1 hypothetical protein GCM10011588_11590 [Nocardia jinanensis]